MAEKKYAIFEIKGGLGKHIAATAVAQVIKKAYPDRELIVVAAWPELWINLPFVYRAYRYGATDYFYQEYIDGVDSLIFAQEPYFCTNHIHKRTRLVETWCDMYGLKYDNEQPVLKINPEQRRAIEAFYKKDKPILLLHTNGGLFDNPQPHCWSRDMPPVVAAKVAQHFHKSHHIIQVTRPNSPHLEEVQYVDKPVSNTELVGLLEFTDKRLLIDSSLQHAAAAFKLPSTVLWNATSSLIFGHSIHDNIEPRVKPKINLPGSYLFDYGFDGNPMEYPYDEGSEADIFDIDQIIHSLENQGQKTSANKGFGK